MFYVVCGLVAAIFQIASQPDSGVPMVGASGAIGGIMGAYVVLYPWVNVHLLVWVFFYVTVFVVPAVWMLGYWFLVQMVSGLVSVGGQGGGVAFWAHVGGFVAGATLIFLFRDPRLLARHPYHGWGGRSSASLYRRVRAESKIRARAAGAIHYSEEDRTMALTGVLRPGHVALRVLDLATAVHHYTEVLGLIEARAMHRAASFSKPGTKPITTAWCCARPPKPAWTTWAGASTRRRR